MANGIEMVFSKEKMIERLTKEMKVGDRLTAEIIATMDNLDGQPVGSHSWCGLVYGQPILTCIGKDGKVFDVNGNDCEFKAVFAARHG